jgi:predicted nucleic acid-binding protein
VSRLYSVDTNLFIEAERSDAGSEALQAFVAGRTAFVTLNAVVAQELRSGARTARQVERLEREVIGPFERRGRLIVPTYWAWKEAGRILSVLFGPGELRHAPRTFVNDALLAMSCRESGTVLITANLRDFERIARVTKFDFVAPWP